MASRLADSYQTSKFTGTPSISNAMARVVRCCWSACSRGHWAWHQQRLLRAAACGDGGPRRRSWLAPFGCRLSDARPSHSAGGRVGHNGRTAVAQCATRTGSSLCYRSLARLVARLFLMSLLYGGQHDGIACCGPPTSGTQADTDETNRDSKFSIPLTLD